MQMVCISASMRFWSLLELGQYFSFDVVNIGHVFSLMWLIKSVQILILYQDLPTHGCISILG